MKDFVTNVNNWKTEWLLLNYKLNKQDTYKVWFRFLERLRGVEVSDSYCAEQFVTFDSLFFQYAFCNWSYNTWVGWVSGVGTNFHSSSNAFKESKSNFVSILLACSICNSYSLASPEECQLMRFEIGKQTGNILGDVYLLLYHKYHYNSNF